MNQDEFGGIAVEDTPSTTDEFGGVAVDAPVAPTAIPDIKIQPWQNQGVFQPSQFSSGAPIGTPNTDNPDWGFTKAVANDPGGFVKSIPSSAAKLATGIVGEVAKQPYLGLIDAVSKVSGNPEFGGNLSKEWATQTQPDVQLPIDKFLSETAKVSPVMTTIAKIDKGLLETAPMFASAGLSAGAQKLLGRYFVADMLYHAPQTAKALYDELQKPKDQRDPDKVTSLISEGIQQLGFGAWGASHEIPAIRDAMISKYGSPGSKLALELNRTQPNIPEGTIARGGSPLELRQQAVPNLSINPNVLGDTSQLQDLVNKALQERNQNIIRPGEVSATDQLLKPTPDIQAGNERNLRANPPGGMLDSSGQEFINQASTPGFLKTAEDKLVARGDQTATREITPEEKAAQPLKTVQGIIESKLKQRDMVGAVQDLLSRPAEVQRSVVDEVNGVGRKRVGLAAGELTIFNQLWENEMAKRTATGKTSEAQTGLESWADEQIANSKKMGITPGAPQPQLLLAYGIKGAAIVGRGITKFADWSAEMVKQFGEGIKAHLDDIWKSPHVQNVLQNGVASTGALLKDLSPEQAAKSNANNSRAAFERVQAEADAKKTQSSQLRNNPSPAEVVAATPDQILEWKRRIRYGNQHSMEIAKQLTPEDIPKLEAERDSLNKQMDEANKKYDESPKGDARDKLLTEWQRTQLKSQTISEVLADRQTLAGDEPTVTLYRGQDHTSPGGQYWAEGDAGLKYAASQGKNVQTITVPKSVADAAKSAAQKEGSGTPGSHILSPDIAKNAEMLPPEKVPNVTQDLTPGETAKNPLHQAADWMENLKSGIKGGTAGQMNALGIVPAVWDVAVSTAQGILRAGGKMVDAVSAAIDYIRKNHKGEFDEAAVRSALDVWKQGGMKVAINDPAKSVIQRMGDRLKSVRDFLTIDPLPKMQRTGMDTMAAIQHASARIAVPHMVNDMLSRVFPDSFKDPAAMSKVMDILNKDNILGGYDEFLSRSREAALAGDTRAANKWKKMADSVGSAQDIEALSKEVEAAKNDPVIAGAIQRWNEVVNPELDTLYNEIKGVDPATEREGRGRVFGARVNLLPKSEEAQWQRSEDPNQPAPSPSSSNYRNPNAKRDKFDRAAKFTGNYSTDAAAVLSNVLYPRWNEVTKLRFYDSLVKSGEAQWLEPGMDLPEGMKRLQVKVPETGESGLTKQVEKTLAVPQNLVGEIRSVLDTDLNLSQNPVAKALTQVQLLQLVDATAHLKNIHSVIAGSQGTKGFFTDIAKKFPGLATGDAVTRISKVVSEILQDSPAIRAELAFMAKNGMLRQNFPVTGIQKITKMQGLIHSVDTASRVVMNRFFDNLVDRGLVENTMKGRRDFVQQIGEYNKRLMSPMMKTMSRSGLSPFIVAGRNFNRFAKRSLIGSPGVTGATTSAALKMRAVNMMGLVTVVAVPAMINALTVGSIWGRRGTPVGAIDLGGQEDDKGNHKVLDLLQLMGIRRGLRATGVESLVEGITNGRSVGQIVDNVVSDVTSTAAHPWMGPALGAGYSILTGKRLDLRGGATPYIARKVASGESQIGENARVTLKNQNALIYSALRPLFDDTEKSYGADIANDFLKAPLSAIGVRDVKSPELMEAQKLAASGEQMTVDQADRAKNKRELAAGVRDDTIEGKKKLADLVASGALTKQAKTDIEKRAALSKIQYTVEKYLTPKDAMQVYQMASPENKDSLRKVIGIKIINNDTLTDDEKKNLFDSISKDSNTSDAMQYPPIKFSIESSGKPYHFLISSKQQFEFEQLKNKNFELVKSNLEANPQFAQLKDAEKESILRSAKSRTDAISKADFFKSNYNTVQPLQ